MKEKGEQTSLKRVHAEGSFEHKMVPAENNGRLESILACSRKQKLLKHPRRLSTDPTGGIDSLTLFSLLLLPLL
ncbi:hypothetical protein TNCT_545281 [Trichonephila clavata]|uniref:Uncharacterized protein n=1 Tax=Trichonephila clavata TaxID=2740835 RepID=A0A8X6L1M2_TRICU|nr:hypothetical protein TNCT_545281 [Trichonephila clavata]